MSHAFITKIMSQVSMPYRRPKSKEVTRRNGTLRVTFTTSGDCLPYGKYPRLFELWACTMVKTHDACFDEETNTLNLGTTFREFLSMLNIQVGGRQLRTIKPQLENLFKCMYAISNDTSNTSEGVAFTVAEKWHIDWLRDEPQEHGLFENTVQLSKRYADYLRDSPVPVDLGIVARLNSPMALDVYWWLTRRFSYLHDRQSIAWQQLYNQFGSINVMRNFKMSFRKAVADVVAAWPEVRVTCGREYVTLYPSAPSVPTTDQARAVGRASSRPSVFGTCVDGHWIAIAGYGRVWWTSGAFDVGVAREHLEGGVEVSECPVCAFDARNTGLHGSMQSDQ